MASKVRIISNAYVKLGKGAINSVQNNPQYGAVSNLYDLILPFALTKHPWRFAARNMQLSESTETSPFDRWSKVFLMPAEQLLSYRTDPITTYEIFGKKLYTNRPSIKLEFVFLVAESNFPTYFENYMVAYLASEAAMTVTQDEKLEAQLEKKAEKVLALAEYLDSTVQPNPVPVRDQIWLAHRVTGQIDGPRFA